MLYSAHKATICCQLIKNGGNNMTSEIKIFKHPEFGSIRVTEQNGEPWFVAKDIAEPGSGPILRGSLPLFSAAFPMLSGRTEKGTPAPLLLPTAAPDSD